MGAEGFQRGDTYLFPGSRDSRLHLWVVCSDCSDPKDGVVVVSITTVYDDQAQDTTCILDIGDHEFVKHTSVVFYGLAEIHPLGALNKLLASRRVREGRPVASDVLRRIVAGFDESPDTPPECQRLLEEQGYIE